MALMAPQLHVVVLAVLFIALALLGHSVTAAAAAAAQRQKKKPNLLVILTDQHRFDAIRRTQEELNVVPEAARIRTPHLDRLSREGAYFTNAYSHCAVCGPSRTSLLLGRTIENTGVRTNFVAYEKDMNLPGNDARFKIPNLRTYDEILVEDHGYVAELYGKWHTPESKGYVYSNDVRQAGTDDDDGGTGYAWFGKFEDHDNGNATKHLSRGMENHYRDWLGGANRTDTAEIIPANGEQRNTFSHRPYVPDTLDKRYGMTSNATADVVQPDQHGRNALPDGFSITAQQGNEALEALERLHESGDPFSLHLSFHSPHAPMIPTAAYHSMYNPDDLAVPASISDDMANSAYARRRRRYKDQGYANVSKVQRWTANYYGLISEIDEWIGRFLDKLDDLGIANETLLAFSSDHGEMLGAHGMREKNVFYEESSHIPLMLRFPGIILPGTMVDAPISLLDLHSTFLDYLGAQGDYETDGTSLRGHIEGTDDADNFVVTMWNYTDVSRGNPGRPSKDPAFMIRKGTWKLMIAGSSSVSSLDMLFNLCADPSEVNNLLGTNGPTASEETVGKAEHLKALLVNYLDKAGHPAVDEVRQRRTWRTPTFWVGESTIRFRKLLPNGTRTEYLYVGTTSDGDVKIEGITIKGEIADHFSIDSEECGASIPGNQHCVVTIKYSAPRVEDDIRDQAKSSAELVIRHGAGKEKVITLIRPGTLSPNSCFSTSEASLKCVADRLEPGEKLSFGDVLCFANRRFGLSAVGDLTYWIDGKKIWNAGIVENGKTLKMQRDGVLIVKDADRSNVWSSNGVLRPEKRMKPIAESILMIDGGGPRLVAPSVDITWVFDCEHFFCV